MAISTCTITGNVSNLLNTGVQNCTLKIFATTPFWHSAGPSWISGELESVVTDASGNFSVTVIETQTPGVKVTFQFSYYDGVANRKIKNYSVVVPNQASALLSDLVTANTPIAGVNTWPAQNVTIAAGTGLTSTNAQAAFTEIATDITAINTSLSGKQSSSLTSAHVLVGNGSNVATDVAMTGDVTINNTGATTVNTVGTSSAANIHTAEVAANAATSANTASTIVKRDASGNFTAGTITANLTGNVTGNVTGNASGTAASITGSLTGDVTSTGMATTYNNKVPLAKGGTNADLSATGGSNQFLKQSTLGGSVTVGTIGTSDLPTVPLNKGGTNADLSATGGSGNYLKQASSGAAITVGTIPNTDLSGITNTQLSGSAGITNANLATMAAHTYKGNNTGVSATPIDLTATQLTAELNAMVGDSGSGGTKGLVPAPGAGDAAAGKVLKADGTWGSAGTTSPLTTKGDLYTYSSANARLAVGTDYQDVIADSGATTGLRWTNRYPGPKNYITYKDFENNATTGWSLAHSALTSNFPSTVATATNSFSSAGGAHGGSAANGNLSIAVTSSSPIAGTYSLNYVSAAATTAGDMLISDALTLDKEDQAKVLQFSFAYSPTSNPSNANWSGSSSNSFGVAIYDVTNAAWIMPAGVWNLVQSTGVGLCRGTFQTPSNMTQFQIALFNVNATSGAITVELDDFFCGPQTLSMGPATTDWVAYTPTTSGLGTITSVALESRRVGDSLEIRGSFSTGTVAGSVAQITLGYNGVSGNVTADSSKLAGSNQVVGYCVRNAANTDQYFLLCQASQGYLTIGDKNGTNSPLTNANGSTLFGSAEAGVQIYAVIPIQGWSSNTAQSSDTDTRVISFQAYKTATQSVTANVTNITFTSVSKDSAGAWNGTDTYTVPVSGDYVLSAGVADNASTSQDFTIYKNGSALTQRLCTATSGAYTSGTAVVPGLKAGDTLTLRSNATTTLAAVGSLSISRLSGPAVVQATESVNGRYYSSSTSISGSDATITYATKDFDSHNAYSGGTLTIPVSGKYQINAGLNVAATYSTGNFAQVAIYKNGAAVTNSRGYAGGAQGNFQANVNDVISCLAGDLITIRASTSGTTPSVQSSTTENWVSWARVGN